jgi:O-antigen/teichoic acid export membrane protein
MVIGWVLMAFAFLVMFFYPAAAKLGETRFGIIAACLGVTGLVMSVVGVGIRRRNR